MEKPKRTQESFECGSDHTGSRIESDMQKNIDRAVELKSQVVELRDYLIGSRGVMGSAGGDTREPEGLFGRLSEANSTQQEILRDISDIIMEIRNYF